MKKTNDTDIYLKMALSGGLRMKTKSFLPNFLKFQAFLLSTENHLKELPILTD